MRTLLSLIIVTGIIYVIYRYIKKTVSNIDFGQPRFAGADFLAVVNGNGFSTVDLSTVITNKNNFSIPVDNLYMELYYQGNLIGKSTVPHEKFTVPKNGSITLSQNITLSLANSLGIGAKLIAKQPIVFDYMVKGVIFNFFPLKFNSSFTYP